MCSDTQHNRPLHHRDVACLREREREREKGAEVTIVTSASSLLFWLNFSITQSMYKVYVLRIQYTKLPTHVGNYII